MSLQLPAFDNTLGALYVGSSVATILYGVTCLQFFLYITSARSQEDRWWLRGLVYLLLSPFAKPAEYSALDSAHQLTMTAAMYKFLVSDFLNPLLLPSGGPGSAEIFTYAQTCVASISVLFVQLFFCWRIWMFSMAALELKYRILFTALTGSLALLSFASSIDLAVEGFNHRLLEGNTPHFILAYELSSSTRVCFDVMVTIAMTISLQRARPTGDMRSRGTDHVITLITLFTVNTNFLTTCFSIAELATFLALPSATIYGGIGFISAKTYLNSFLAVLNSRDYLREKLEKTVMTPVSTTLRREEYPTFAVPGRDKHSGSAATRDYSSQSFELSTVDHNISDSKESKPSSRLANI